MIGGIAFRLPLRSAFHHGLIGAQKLRAEKPPAAKNN
jgi:hypothetical protein